MLFGDLGLRDFLIGLQDGPGDPASSSFFMECDRYVGVLQERVSVNFWCRPSPVYGSYVSVSFLEGVSHQSLSLCEVEVFVQDGN